MGQTRRRRATHAGTWYPAGADALRTQLAAGAAPARASVRGARVVVAPHAGYKYCSRTMLRAYESLDLGSRALGEGQYIRVFVVGPSHHVYFKNRYLLSSFDTVATPLGDLAVDRDTVGALLALGGGDGHADGHADGHVFKEMSEEVDLEEHSLEMQFSMLVHAVQLRGVELARVRVVPILVSHSDRQHEMELASMLAGYVREDARSFVVISSDFCHWGRRFEYTGYVGSREELEEAMREETEIEMLTSRSKLSHHQIPIWQSVELLDRHAMAVLRGGDYDTWNKYLDITANTICGRTPLGILLLMLQELGKTVRWEWLEYSQSSKVTSIAQSSVSYSSAYITIE